MDPTQVDEYGNSWRVGKLRHRDGFEMAYHFTESSEKLPKLVYLHGLTASGPRFIPVFAKIANKFQIFLPSARGHGKSSVFPEGTFTMQNAVDDAAALIRTISPSEKVFLVGFSFGGSTAARTAKQYPGLVRGLVLEDPPWKRKCGEPFIVTPDQPGPWLFFRISKIVRAMTDAEFEPIRNNSPFSVLPGDAPHREFPDFGPTKAPFSQSLLEDLRDLAVENVEKTFLNEAEKYITEAVEGIEVPCLLFTGDPKKAHCRPEVAQHTLKTWSSAQEKNFVGAGHGMHNPPYQKEYLEAIESFFFSLLKQHE